MFNLTAHAPKKPKLVSLSACIALAFGLAACGDDAGIAANSAGAITPPKSAQMAAAVTKGEMGPVQTTLEVARLAKSNDLKGMLQLSLPGAEIKKMAAAWETKRSEPITDANRKEFADGISKLLAPGAIDEAMAMIEPGLTEYKAQMPMYIGMGMMGLQQSIASNADMSEAQKKQAGEMLTALQGWATKTDLTDPSRARKALTELANGVRATNITTLDQLQGLSFDQVMGKGGVMFGSMKRALNAYDLNMDDMFSSVKAEQVSMSGDSAVIKSTVTFLGQTISTETPMIKLDGHWYGKDGIEALKKAVADAEAKG